MLIPFHLNNATVNLRIDSALLVTSVNCSHIRDVLKFVCDDRPLITERVPLLDRERARLLVQDRVPDLTFVQEEYAHNCA